MIKKKLLRVCTNDSEVAYVMLPEHPGKGTAGCVVKQVRIVDLIKDYKGPDIHLDFDRNGCCIGIDVMD